MPARPDREIGPIVHDLRPAPARRPRPARPRRRDIQRGQRAARGQRCSACARRASRRCANDRTLPRWPPRSAASARRRSSSAKAAQVKRCAVRHAPARRRRAFRHGAQQLLGRAARHLRQIAELLVVPDLQAGHAPGLGEVELHRGDGAARVVAQPAQRIELAVIAGRDDDAVVQPRRQPDRPAPAASSPRRSGGPERSAARADAASTHRQRAVQRGGQPRRAPSPSRMAARSRGRSGRAIAAPARAPCPARPSARRADASAAAAIREQRRPPRRAARRSAPAPSSGAGQPRRQLPRAGRGQRAVHRARAACARRRARRAGSPGWRGSRRPCCSTPGSPCGTGRERRGSSPRLRARARSRAPWRRGDPRRRRSCRSRRGWRRRTPPPSRRAPRARRRHPSPAPAAPPSRPAAASGGPASRPAPTAAQQGGQVRTAGSDCRLEGAGRDTSSQRRPPAAAPGRRQGQQPGRAGRPPAAPPRSAVPGVTRRTTSRARSAPCAAWPPPASPSARRWRPGSRGGSAARDRPHGACAGTPHMRHRLAAVLAAMGQREVERLATPPRASAKNSLVEVAHAEEQQRIRVLPPWPRTTAPWRGWRPRRRAPASAGSGRIHVTVLARTHRPGNSRAGVGAWSGVRSGRARTARYPLGCPPACAATATTADPHASSRTTRGTSRRWTSPPATPVRSHRGQRAPPASRGEEALAMHAAAGPASWRSASPSR